MTSPLLGVWELASDNDKGIYIFTETHFGAFVKLSTGAQRAFIGSHTINNNRVDETMIASSEPNAPLTGALTAEVDGDTLTMTLINPGRTAAAGRVFIWRKLSDLHMTSPFAGVWQLISNTDTGVTVRTDTHLVHVVNREIITRGFAATYTTHGNRVTHTVLMDTSANAAPQFDIDLKREGDTLTVNRISGTIAIPTGHIDCWRKIG